MSFVLRLFVVVILSLLAGCYSTGRQFARPNLDAFEFRRTTPGEIVAGLRKT